MTALTLTRAEAAALADELEWTADAHMFAEGLCDLPLEASSPDCARSAVDALKRAIRRLELEITIREGGDWWGERGPAWLDLSAFVGTGECPDMFALSADAAAALREFLDAERLDHALEYAHERRAADTHEDDVRYTDRQIAGLQALAARLDIDLEPVTGMNTTTVHAGDLAPGRELAKLEVIAGFQRALTKLHPADDVKRAWLERCLNAACRAAGIPPATRDEDR